MLDYLIRQFDVEKANVVPTLLERNPDAKLFDCGCSNGEFTLIVGQTIGTSKLFGIEIEEERVESASAKGVHVSIGDLNSRLPFEEANFDCVLANHVIEHLVWCF